MLELLLVGCLAVQDPTPEPIVIQEVLAVGSTGRRSRSPIYTDSLIARMVRGDWSVPSAGDEIAVAGTDRTRTWARFEADANGQFSGRPFRGGWAFATVQVPVGGAWRMDLRGASMVYVDGAPRAGDVYNLGLTRFPVALEVGEHHLLFKCGRGRLRAELQPAPADVYLEEKDRTLPDALRDGGQELQMGQIVANASSRVASGYRVLAHVGSEIASSDVPDLGPGAMRKCVVRIRVPKGLAYDTAPVRLELVDRESRVVHESEFSLNVRTSTTKHVRTFLSAVDGSVQYFGVTPPSESTPGVDPALVLSLHGAGVQARGQANSYAQKRDMVVVAPTNRRRFGFDWEDTGRLDAIEVLQAARSLFGTDDRRTYLTGHSMGGHGTWQVGAQFPGTFAAIAPSAGWREFWTYAGGSRFPDGDAIGAMLARAANPSRTTLLDTNYRGLGVYILHGDADNNVPVSEARAMRKRLSEFHPNFAYYEQPGAGHWWGNRCVDWPPLFAFLRENVKPEASAIRRVEFVTANPAVSASRDWVTIVQQERWLEPSRVTATLDVDKKRVEVDGSNVARIALDLSAFEALADEDVVVRIGDAELSARAGRTMTFARKGDSWGLADAALAHKNPRRSGPFKQAFRNRMVFVYGTGGSPAENAWAFGKARYDHEMWRYRGNGAVDLVADSAFVAEFAGRSDAADRNVILYGHRDMNAAWGAVLASEPFDVRRGALRVGARELTGDDLALLVIHPRKGSDVASVGVIAGTGLPGLRTTTELPYFVSGVAYPDWTVLEATFADQGLGGVRATGFFDSDWSVGADQVWR